MAHFISGSSRISTMDILAMIREPEVPPYLPDSKFFNIAEIADKILSLVDFVEKILF